MKHSIFQNRHSKTRSDNQRKIQLRLNTCLTLKNTRTTDLVLILQITFAGYSSLWLVGLFRTDLAVLVHSWQSSEIKSSQ